MLFEEMQSWNPNIYLPLVVLMCSVVQSLVGVGLLLFGTPTLLLLGMDFGSTLAVLLPCSLVINLCQLQKGLPANKVVLFKLMRITLPMLFIGLLIALGGLNTHWMPILVGGALLCLGILRMSTRAAAWLSNMVSKYQNSYMAVMGLVHGLSNMGGGLLVSFATTVSDEKEEIRKIIAMGYFMFALTQFGTLVLFHTEYLRIESLYLPMISVVTYLIGNVVFQYLNTTHFNHLVTSLVLTYGMITLGKVFF